MKSEKLILSGIKYSEYGSTTEIQQLQTRYIGFRCYGLSKTLRLSWMKVIQSILNSEREDRSEYAANPTVENKDSTGTLEAIKVRNLLATFGNIRKPLCIRLPKF